METSNYNYDRLDKLDQTPDLSPLQSLEGYMSRTGMDDPGYFNASAAAFTSLQGGDTYTLAPQNLNQREHPDFPMEFLPSGATVPRAYPGAGIDPTATTTAATNNPADPTTFCELDPSSALYNDRDSSEDCLNGNSHGQDGGPFGTYSFLPSPPDADGASNHTNAMTPGISPRQTVAPTFGAVGDGILQDGNAAAIHSQRADRKKRRRHSSPVVSTTDKDKGSQGLSGDEKRKSTTQLRTASRAPKRYSQSTARKPAETAEEVKARAAHNQVEQQYRKRLNAQFERLLQVLPQQDYDEEGMDEDGGGEGGRSAMEKRISKAEVLDLARRRIKTLEREKEKLEREKEQLLLNQSRVQHEWNQRITDPMPTVKIER
jgi:hypothetical protein